MRRTRMPKDTLVSALSLAAVALTLSACDLPWTATPTAAGPEVVRTAELDDASGRPCPRSLPVGDDPSGHGFGTTEAATDLPALRETQEAWVCEYVAVHGHSATGTVYSWVRDGSAEPVADSDLPALREALGALTLPDVDQACTDDLGPRWMVVSTHDGDLTGVVVDDYGCRAVRLTDNPHATAPGAGGQEGTVAGVLDGGTAILDVLRIGRASGE
ncbi:hypothetical protein [Nocardioides sp. SR21]|uniref:hypothetical protein n=1 Tax=Nocardioides sp. SR21 TaxID=2919501 RepID=UPI001FA9980A|nr:hypothetical protein [Nocardioides sp. SR21]